MKELKQSETIIFNHKGVEVLVKLDYDRGQVSFVNDDGKPKRWLFAERDREFLGGWVLIFEALEEATVYADQKLKEQKDIREKFDWDDTVALVLSLEELREQEKAK